MYINLFPCFFSDTKDILVMLSDMDINAIAGTLKLYFRELPEPLLTDRLYPAFMEGIGMTFYPLPGPLTSQTDSFHLILEDMGTCRGQRLGWEVRSDAKEGWCQLLVCV